MPSASAVPARDAAEEAPDPDEPDGSPDARRWSAAVQDDVPEKCAAQVHDASAWSAEQPDGAPL